MAEYSGYVFAYSSAPLPNVYSAQPKQTRRQTAPGASSGSSSKKSYESSDLDASAVRSETASSSSSTTTSAPPGRTVARSNSATRAATNKHHRGLGRFRHTRSSSNGSSTARSSHDNPLQGSLHLRRRDPAAAPATAAAAAAAAAASAAAAAPSAPAAADEPGRDPEPSPASAAAASAQDRQHRGANSARRSHSHSQNSSSSHSHQRKHHHHHHHHPHQYQPQQQDQLQQDQLRHRSLFQLPAQSTLPGYLPHSHTSIPIQNLVASPTNFSSPAAPAAAATTSNKLIKSVPPSVAASYALQRVHSPTEASKHVTMLSETEPGKLSKLSSPFSRTESISSTSGTTGSLSTLTMTSSDPASSLEGLHPKRPYSVRCGRTYLGDPTLPYPLPIDLAELHRQHLRTLLLIQVFRTPVCSPSLLVKPPTRVLEIGCGSGFWSMMCHRYFKGKGHGGISFTGLDVAPVGVGTGSPPGEAIRPDRDMNWRFVQHDMRHVPFPFQREEFDLVMVKDVSLATSNSLQQVLMDEYLRLLRPGGSLEIWESDHTVRMLRPHVPNPNLSADDVEEQTEAASLGAYVMTANTPLSAPLNPFLVEYNGWITRALEARNLTAVPCTVIGPMLLQEHELLCDVRSRRLAIPLSEVRWEKEGVGGVVTKDGKSYVDWRGKSKAGVGGDSDRKSLSAGQAALRKTALLTVVQQIQSLEPALREVSSKSQDEWDGWLGKMMNDLIKESGTLWGECLEVGAWWARKKGRRQ